MKAQTLSQITKRVSTIAVGVAASTLATSILAPAALANPLALGTEGEIDTGFGCLQSCLKIPLVKKVTSIGWDDADTAGYKEDQFSRLFIDVSGSANTYTNGQETVKFGKTDKGTNPNGAWFRPVAPNEEAGRLEAGTFKFDFTKTMKKLTIDFFDVERQNFTGVLAVNGDTSKKRLFNDKAGDARGNSTMNTLTLFDVDSIVLKLGADFANTSGDGVSFRIRELNEAVVSVPEPSGVVGLGLLAGVSALGLGKGQNRDDI